MHRENSLKLTWVSRRILGVLRLALIPLSRDSRGAQDDQSKLISSKETIFTAVGIQTDPSVDRRDHSLAHPAGERMRSRRDG